MPANLVGGVEYCVYAETKVFARFPSDMLEDRYRLVAEDGSELPSLVGLPVPIPIVGRGGFGIVIRAKDRVGLDRAVKLVDLSKIAKPQRGANVPLGKVNYDEYFPTEEDTDSITKSFEEEIKHTNARPFKHIVPIIDYGQVTDLDENPIPYYVQPFIRGSGLNQVVANRLRILGVEPSRLMAAETHDLFLALIDDLLAAVEELEQAKVIHMDISPSNTMVLPATSDGPSRVSRMAKPDALFLIDLGAARSAEAPAKTVPLIATTYYFPQHLLEKLGHVNGRLDHSKLMAAGSRIDLYSVGRVLEQVFLDRARRRTKRYRPDEEMSTREAAKERMFQRVVEDDFSMLEGLIDRLMDTETSGFPSATEARLAFQSVSRRAAHSVFASRVLTDQTSGIRVRLGRTLVRVAPPFDQIVDHPVFQRLRRIQQLSLLSEVFPDATHTRFAHVLHTFQMGKRFVRGLYRDSRFRQIFTQRDADQVLAAALLHDIGQYPFSHTIEDLRKLGDLSKTTHLQAIKYDQELASEYIQKVVPGHGSIAQILTDCGYSVEAITYMFQKTAKNRDDDALNIGRDIISGVIDVDRVAYLLVDSDRSGMSFGAAMDVDGLVEALCVRPRSDKDGASLAIDEDGVSAVEAMLTAVYWMYRNVYWRHTNRGFMAAVKFVFQELSESGELTFDQYKEWFYGRSEWEAVKYLHDRYDELVKKNGHDWYNPLERLVRHERFGYRRMFAMGASKDKLDELYGRIITGVSPRSLRQIVDRIRETLPKSSNPRVGDILIDVPLKKRLRDAYAGDDDSTDTIADAGSRPRMWVRKRLRGGRELWEDLYSRSPLAASLGGIEDHSGRKIRIFFSRELLGRLSDCTEHSIHKLIVESVEESG